MIKRDKVNLTPYQEPIKEALNPGATASKKRRIQAQLTDGNPSYKELSGRTWRLAWPAVGEQMLNMAVGLTNVFFVGHLTLEASKSLGYTGADALAAVAIANFMQWIVMVIYMSLAIASTALVARAIGAKDYSRATDIARQSMLLALVIGAVCSVLMFMGADALMWLYGANDNLSRLGSQFLRTTSFTMVFSAVLYVGNACLRATGDTRTPLIFIGLTNVINIIISGSLVNGIFGIAPMGVEGAALGMMLSGFIGGAIVGVRLLGIVHRRTTPTKRGIMPIYIREKGKMLSFRLENETLRNFISVGLPTLGENMVFQLGIFFFGRMIVGLGTIQYAAFNLSVTIDSISFMPGQAIGLACTVLVGQCLGAGKPDLAVRYVKVALVMGVAFMASMGLSFALFPQFFLNLMVNDQQVIAAATDPLRVAGTFSPIIGISFIMLGVLRGAGDTRVPLYGRVLSTLGVRLSFAFFAINVVGWGLIGSRIAMGLDALTLTIILVWRFRGGKWRTAFQEKVTSATSIANPALKIEEAPLIKPASEGIGVR